MTNEKRMTVAEFVGTYPLEFVDEIIVQWDDREGKFHEESFPIPSWVKGSKAEALCLGETADMRIKDVVPRDLSLILITE